MRYISTLRGDLGPPYLQGLLAQAETYDRIAGYFRSSVFEVAGKELELIPGRVRILCNHELDPTDVKVARLSQSLRRGLSSPDSMSLLPEVKERYRRLHALLITGRIEIRVMVGTCLLHCKTALVRLRDGSTIVLNGSVNETRSGWSQNHEIMSEDTSPDSAIWMEKVFEEYWAQSIPLPEAVVDEMLRLSDREEFPTLLEWRKDVEVATIPAVQEQMAAAALVETPIFMEGHGLLPWQKGFVSIFMQRRASTGAARLLLADEVGLGKTMSLGACAMLSVLMGDGPVLIVVPAALVRQWQQELKVRLGLSAMAWSSQKGRWIYPDASPGPCDFLSCPSSIGIVSSGLVVQDTVHVEAILGKEWGMVIMDEAHKARSSGLSNPTPNRMMKFLRSVGERTRHLLLASATPMQLRFSELHELVEALGRGRPEVIGGPTSPWRGVEDVEKWLSHAWPTNPELLLRLIDEPRLPGCPLVELLNRVPRGSNGVPLISLMEDKDIQQVSSEGRSILSNSNPFLHHVVLRRRVDVAGLMDERTNEAWLKDIKVTLHPTLGLSSAGRATLDAANGAVEMGVELSEVYDTARIFTIARMREMKGRGFLATLLLRRIGSSPIAGRKTMEALMSGREEQEEEDEFYEGHKSADGMTLECMEHAKWALERLEEMGNTDPKAEVLLYHLRELGWKDAGCIIFSQYLDTASAVAERLSREFPTERIGLYAGGNKSCMFVDGLSEPILQEDIRSNVASGNLHLLVATDAACEGLNLQALGTLVNYDLPWNPAKLEQRLGRIRRIGQEREEIHLLNLRYTRSVEDRVFQLLGMRTKGIFDVLAQIPESLMNAEWIEALLEENEQLDCLMGIYENKRQVLLMEAERNPFIRKYGGHAAGMVTPGMRDWERQSRVLRPSAVRAAISEPWSDKQKTDNRRNR